MNKRGHLYSVPNPPQGPSSGGSGQGSGGDVDARLRKVEAELVRISADLKHMATKEDIQKMQNNNLRWIIGILVAAIALFVREFFFK